MSGTDKKIDIQLQMVGELTFQYTVNVDIYPAGTAYFANTESAKGSPLAERIFEVKDVDNILIAKNVIKVTMTRSFEDWANAPKQIEYIIRDQLLIDEPALSPLLTQNIPSESEIRAKVIDVLEKEVNPFVAQHGGFIELTDVKRNNIYLRLGGGCQGCASSVATLKQGVEIALRKAVPGLGDIHDVTDHESGKNPYF
ncbi:MAG: NifU family protein [Deltaproteobacteria bacterium]|nr:NifU family protein [Deltaproteobacteria bacterium]